MPKSLKDERSRRIAEVGYDFASQPKNYIENCNLCGESQFVIIAHEDRYGFPASAHACMRCGLIFLNPVMTAEAYSEFYQQYYRPLVSAYLGRQIDAQTVQAEQKEYADRLVEFIAPFISGGASKSLLDIGGSTGVVAAEFVHKHEYSATVLDPAPPELQKAKEMGFQTEAGLLEDYDPGEKKFDLILLCQTVDHLLDVSGALEKIRKMMHNESMFFIDIVDFRAGCLSNWSVEKALKIDHPYNFTETAIEAYLHKFGFWILRKSYMTEKKLVGYLCGLDEVKMQYLPTKESVEFSMREVRKIQNMNRYE